MSEKLKQNHLEHIDFIKGLAAISVILLHTLPQTFLYVSLAVYHIWQAVPVFLFITFYLGFRNLEKKKISYKEYYSIDRIKVIFIKLWVPLIILALLEAIFFFVCGNSDRAIGSLFCYNNGPGSYYIWLYMQIWLLLPLVHTLLKKIGILLGGGILLIISVLGDYCIEAYLGCTPKFLCFRYIFLSVPALIYLKGVNIKRLFPFILISIVYLFLMHYSKVPKLLDTVLPDGWEAQTSLGFFYTLLLFVFLTSCYDKLKNRSLTKYITNIGTISWEVFLIQMIVLGSGVIDYSTKFFQSTILQVGYKVLMVLLISLFSAKLFKKILLTIFNRV